MFRCVYKFCGNDLLHCHLRNLRSIRRFVRNLIVISVILHILVYFWCRFPKDPELRQKWINAVRRKDYVPSSTAVLCSAHFREEDLDRTSASKIVRVRDNAVPSLFSAFPKHLQKETKTRRPPQKRSLPVCSV